MNATLSHRESDQDYRAIVATLNARWRVIACRDGIQWILQQRKGERRGQSRFDSRSYCRTKSALMRVCREHAGEIEPNALATLEALPAQIGGAR